MTTLTNSPFIHLFISFPSADWPEDWYAGAGIGVLAVADAGEDWQVLALDGAASPEDAKVLAEDLLRHSGARVELID